MSIDTDACVKCGAATVMAPFGIQRLCEPCLDVAFDGAERWRGEKARLVAVGVHPKIASAILCVRIERGEAPP